MPHVHRSHLGQRGRRGAVAVLLVALLGCASGGGSSASPTSVLVSTQTQIVERSDDARSRDSLDAPPSRAYLAVINAYGALGVTPSMLDRSALVVGIENLRLVRRFAGRPLSAYLDCGSGLTGRHADDWQIVVSIVSHVVPAAQGHAVVETRVDAEAQDNAGTSTKVLCGSTGVLEQALAAKARDALAHTP